MKRSLVIISILLMSSFHALPQEFAIDKGGTIISGTGSFTSSGGDLYEWDGDRITTIMLTPAVDHFFAPNIALGCRVNYTGQSLGDYSYHAIGIGPSLSYFIGDSGSKSYSFFACGIQYYNAGDDDSSILGTEIFISGGILAPIRDHVGIVIEAGYHMMNLKSDDWDESESGNEIMLGIGVAGLLY
jgi:hypothetical protein